MVRTYLIYALYSIIYEISYVPYVITYVIYVICAIYGNQRKPKESEGKPKGN
jgi:hypothetical protein